MRKIFTFSAVLILLVFASTWVSAQVLETETFNYVLGDTLNGFNGWLGHSGVGTNPEKDTVGLTYAGYIGSGIGGASTLTTTGEDINKVWASYPNGVTSGTIYYSLLVELDSAQTSADYFFHLFKNSTTFSARLYAKKAFTRDSISFGILKGSTFANVAWSDSVYKRGTPYLIVVKYTFVPGSANDTVSMWINPNISGTEPTPTVFETTADKSTTDDDTVYGVAIRQGSATQAPRGRVGAIRAVQSWKNINNKYAVLSKNSINFSNITLGTVVKDSVIITDNDMTSINVSSVTSGNSVFVVSPTSATIAVGSSQKFYVTYTPTATVTTSSAIVFNSDGASSPDSVYVTGNAIVPGFGISTKSYNFGQLYLDSTLVDSVTVTNLLASSTLNITSVTSSNPFFTVGPTSGSLAVGASMKFGVKFMPTAAGVTTSSIVFFNNGGLVSDTLKVAGNGLLKAPLISATPILKDYHGVWVGHAWKDSVTVKNTGYDSLKITGVTSSDPTFVVTPTTAQLDTQATKKFYITFTPTALGAKSASIVFLSNDTTHAKDTVMAIGTGVTYSTIANAREDLNGDLIPDHSVTGDTLIIAGVITSKNLQSVGGQTAIYIQDSTAGVEIFGYALPPVTMVIGDSVFAIGVVEQYHGLTEFYPLEPSYDVLDTLHFGILKHNATVPKPKHLTYHQYVANSESYEGLLVEIDTLYKKSGTWPGVSTSASIYLTTLGGTDSTEMYISSSTDIAGSVEPSYPINVVAIISQYSSGTTLNNGYEIEPSDSVNIVHTKFAPLVKISEARRDSSNLIAVHSVIGDTLMIAGVITSPNLQVSNTAYFVQDTTAGVEVFAYGLGKTFVVGDSVAVVGTVAQYHGLTEFTPLVLDSLHFALLKHKAVVPKPKLITLSQYVTNSESYEGLLIQIDTLFKASGTWPVASSSATIYVTDKKADTAQMYINASTDIGGSAEPTYPVDLVCIGGQYSSGTTLNNGYELFPRDTADFTHITVTSVADAFSGIPTTFVLENNYPNPFNPSTTILYGIATQSHVTVKIYSVLGQEMATLVNDIQGPSYYRVIWDGKDSRGNMASSGVYFFRIIADPVDGKTSQFMQVKKMLLMK